MTIKEFIESAIEGGYEFTRKSVFTLNNGDIIGVDSFILDPEAWKAVGKVKGWKLQDEENYQSSASLEYWDNDEWKTRMANMITFFIDKGTLEEYIATL